MKVYSWNMFCFNTRQNAAYDFIRGADFDVFCLQEVPETFLARLKELPYHLAFAPDSVMLVAPQKTMTHYAVILSRFPLSDSGPIRFPKAASPLRARLLTKAMKPFGWRKNAGKGSVWADTDVPGIGRVRFFSLHLSLSSPTRRREEIELIAKDLPPDIPAILAGDFNVIEHALVQSLNWFLGSSIRESHPFHRERKYLEERFAHYKFKNPLRGKVTHGFSRSQLDHILVPEGFTVTDASVIRKTYGSDHRPVFVSVGTEALSGAVHMPFDSRSEEE
jgi:endonuclease/exonuclease/phosphatase family metal-dependent hydrolase